MNNTDTATTSRGLNEYGRRRIIQVLVTLFIAVGIFLIAAGRLDWP